MEAANVFRVMSLIPERAPRTQSGCVFSPEAAGQVVLLTKFLHWLCPLESLSKEDQQLLGLRPSSARPVEEEELEAPPELEEEHRLLPDLQLPHGGSAGTSNP